MKFLKAATFFLTIAILGNTSLFAQANSDKISKLLNERDQEIKELLGSEGSEYTDEQRSQLKDIINGIIDFRAMAKYALEDTYSNITDEQREEFVELFSSIIRDQSLNKLDIYRAKVTYESINVEENTARVETLAELDEVRTPVHYDMAYQNDEWVITDMVIDDVSTAESYNRQFQRIITRRGFDALMTSLRKRAARAN